jgi:hypothetical protein
MQRLTARFLLLFALVGTFVPLALAATATPRACCLRKSAHPCHGTQSEEFAIRATGCCSHDCFRGVTTSQSAHPQQSLTPAFARDIDSKIADARSASPASRTSASQSTRAPPAC